MYCGLRLWTSLDGPAAFNSTRRARSASAAAVNVAAEPYGPISTWAPSRISSAYASPARTASEPSSLNRSSTRRPSRPPAALISSCQRTKPFRYSPAGAACAPDSDTTAPMVIAESSAAAWTVAAASSSALIIQPVIDGVAAHRNERRALEGHEHRTVGLLAGGAHRDDAVVRTGSGFALADHFGLGVDRVAGENGRRQAHLVPAKVGHGFLAHVGDAHAGNDGECECGVDERPAKVRGSTVYGVDVQRVLVHGEQREPDVVRLRERAARAMLVDVADLEILVIATGRFAIALRSYFLCAADHKRIRRAMIEKQLGDIVGAAEGSCQIGGNLSTNAGGVNVLRYGTAREQVLGLEVVLPDGRVWDGLRGLRKDNTGYDLKQVFLGAEGTLGIITAAVLRLHPKPSASATAWIALESAAAAMELLAFLHERLGDRLSAFELLSRNCIEAVLAFAPGTQDPLARPYPWYVLVEIADSGEERALRERVEKTLMEAAERGALADAAIAQSGEQARALWRIRETVPEAQFTNVKHDVAVPISSTARFIERAAERLEKRYPDVRIYAFGHVGDGNIHYNVGPERLVAERPAVNRIVYDTVAELGGSVSAEHGLGQLKRDEIP